MKSGRANWKQGNKKLSKELRAREDSFLSDQLRRDSKLLKIMKEREDAMQQNMLQKAYAFSYLYNEHQKEISLIIE